MKKKEPLSSPSPPPAGVQDNYLFNLQKLRGLAALFVLVFHFGPHLNAIPGLAWLYPYTRYGFAGVDIFFVLSGVVIGNSSISAVHRVESHWKFMFRRFARIYLGYWPALLFTAVTSVYVFNKDIPDLFKLFRSVFLLESTVANNWLPTAWSLTYELFFYCIAIVLYFKFFTRRLSYLAFLMLALTAWNVWWLIFQRETVYAGAQPVRFFLSAYCLEFFIGLMLSEICKNRKLPRELLPVSVVMAVVGLAIGTTSEIFANVEILRVGSFGIFGIGCCLIALILDQHSISPDEGSFLIRIGNASYSIYLLHPTLLDIAGLVRGHLMFLPDILLRVSALSLAFLVVPCCYCWYVYVEQPLYKNIVGKA